MKFLVHGAKGRMGQNIILALQKMPDNPEIIPVDIAYKQEKQAGTYGDIFEVNEKVDVIIDFSHHLTTKAVTDYAVKTNTPLVLCTTGQTEEEKEMIIKASKSVAVFYSGNMSVGIATLSKAVKTVVSAMKNAEIEIVEVHHDKKLDSPSGTALMLASAVKEVRPDMSVLTGRNGYQPKDKNEIGISSIRYGNIVGIHEVIIATETETITLKHEAHTRAVFADGAVTAGYYLCGKTAGLYDMKKLLGDN